MTGAAPSHPNAIAPGILVGGKYRLDRKLGEGGMGVVFLAHNEILQQRVVVKALHAVTSSNEIASARFLREARAAAKIQHEHVARVLDFGTLPAGAPYLVMEFLEGRDLEDEVCARGPLPIAEAVGHVRQALEGLAVAHDVGIVHRDIKPANLFLAKRQGGGVSVKILDFGIAKSDDAPSSSATAGSPSSKSPHPSHANPSSGAPLGSLTATSSMMGSPLFMSPEQFRSAKLVEPRSDLWSMGVVLYRLLTAAYPFEADGVAELMVAILQHPAPSVRSRRPDVPPELDRILLSCLEKTPAARPVDARALADALRPFGESSSSWSDAPAAAMAERSSQRSHPTLAIATTQKALVRSQDPQPERRASIGKIVGASVIFGSLALGGGGLTLAALSARFSHTDRASGFPSSSAVPAVRSSEDERDDQRESTAPSSAPSASASASIPAASIPAALSARPPSTAVIDHKKVPRIEATVAHPSPAPTTTATTAPADFSKRR